MRKVLDIKNLPVRFPVWQTATALLLLEVYNAPGWLWGVMGTIMVLIWFVSIYVFFTENKVDVFEDTKEQIKRETYEKLSEHIREYHRR